MTAARPVFVAGLVSAAGLVAATTIESSTIHLFRLTPTEWLGTSDLLLAIGLGVATWLWMNLRRARTLLQDAERRRIILDTQLSIAADIQAQLLPSMPEPRDDVSWAARLQPAGKIGGDYYDVVELSDGSWLCGLRRLDIGGVPAGLMPNAAYEAARVEQWQDDRTVVAFRIADRVESPLNPPPTPSDSRTTLDALLPRR